MEYMLDTDTSIFVMEEITAAAKKFKKTLLKNKKVYISSITLAELEYGVYRNSNYEANRNKVTNFLKLIPVLLFDNSAAMYYGIEKAKLAKANKTLKEQDLFIGSHALSKKCILVTNNEKDFKKIKDLKIENWTL